MQEMHENSQPRRLEWLKFYLSFNPELEVRA